jgi:CTP:molybdopterin cytidylyltransferase MocA
MVLAAGAGRRFRGSAHKLLTSFRGRPLIWWALTAAGGAGLDELVVVTGGVDLAAVLPPGAVTVVNPDWQDGMATSLQAGLAHASAGGHAAVVVGLADQPLIPASAWAAVGRSTASIAVATYGGRRANPVRLATEVWPLLPRRGEVGAREVIADRPELVVEVACEGNPADVDTLEDLERWS